MAKTFDLKDESVVVVVGSGAGGGTLSNELVQRGINVVCLEAGPRLRLTPHLNHNSPARSTPPSGSANTPAPAGSTPPCRPPAAKTLGGRTRVRTGRRRA